MNHALGKLGTRSLGSLLFGALRAPVHSREFTRLEPESSLHRLLRNHLPDVTEPVYARRAVHLLSGEPLLVTEVFLPGLLTMRADRGTNPQRTP
jgi:chorismate lyase